MVKRAVYTQSHPLTKEIYSLHPRAHQVPADPPLMPPEVIQMGCTHKTSRLGAVSPCSTH
ncbi:hypothetical protein PPTG_19915 [Phytophthora nicotianae INRA-310]|uniref:Uncharacterized protein n=1 Tax=Phytophthora nicotianae (strain INRA-310) TaxID=761204 RepID=W2PA53_PHYN3|nr:hypothetical protein PPTG_19915 [Phytophthora nicotianae INRA-310]ETM97912.1 hypothetical protein PPTG_19915 [Phytophthora nicotianae INRA-310]